MTAAFVASDLTRGALGFATSVIIARGLGRDEFGRWTLYATWASMLTVLFDLGFGVLLTREAARGVRVGALVGGALAARLLAFAPVALAIGALGVGRGGSSAASAQDVYLVLGIAAAGMAYSCLAAVYRASVRWLVAILTVEMLGTAAQCAGSALIVSANGTVTGLLRLAVGVQVAQLAIALVGWHLAVPDDRLARPTTSSTLTVLRRALPFAATGIVANVQARLGPLLLGAAGTPADVAASGVAQRLEAIARRLPSAACGAALPVLAADVERGDAQPLRAQFDGAILRFALAAAGLLAAGAWPIVRVTYGAAFLGAVPVLVWAGVGLVPSLTNAARKVYLFASGRETTVLRWSAVACAVQAFACLALIPSFGAAGAMIAFVAG